MPNRILRDGINDSETVNSVSESAEFFYRRLYTYVDDYGRGAASPTLIRGKVFALRLEAWPEDRIQAMIEECALAGLILYYDVEGKKYLEIQKFGQRLRPGVPSKFPDPRGISPQLAANCGNSPQLAANCGNSPQLAARASTPTTHTPTAPNTNPETEKTSELEKTPAPLHEAEPVPAVPVSPAFEQPAADPFEVAGFGDEFAFGQWWLALVKRHPNKSRNSLARAKLRDEILGGRFSRADFEKWYAAALLNPRWHEGGGHFAPNLHSILDDCLWRHAPPDFTDPQVFSKPKGRSVMDEV